MNLTGKRHCICQWVDAMSNRKPKQLFCWKKRYYLQSLAHPCLVCFAGTIDWNRPMHCSDVTSYWCCLIHLKIDSFPQFSNEQASNEQAAAQKCPSNVHFSSRPGLFLFANCEQELQIASFSSKRSKLLCFPTIQCSQHQPQLNEGRKWKSDPHESDTLPFSSI